MAVAAVQELDAQAESTEATRQPEKQKVNLDEFEEFRNYKSARDKETAQIRKQQEALARQLEQITQQTREQKLANMDDYEREKFEKEEAKAEAAYWKQQHELTLVQQQRAQALAQIAQKYKVPMEAIEAAGDPAEARDLAWEWREKQLEQENTRSLETQQARAAKKEANRVEVGSGKPSSPDGEWEREYQRLLKAGDNRGAIRHALTKPKE
jgi:hypothetical protein